MSRSGETALYRFHDVVLEVNQEVSGKEVGLSRLLQDLSFVPLNDRGAGEALRLTVRMSEEDVSVPLMAKETFDIDGLCGRERGDDFYLTEGTSLFHLQVLKGQGEAILSPAFFQQPALLQQRFWGFGLLRLLRPLGVYGLHAAGMVAQNGLGCLIIGPTGSGKSTLALELIRRGWGYLSDDAVLLRSEPENVRALAFRKPFSIDTAAASAYAGFPLKAAGLDPSGSQKPKQRIDIQDGYPEQHVPACLPRVLFFPRIVPNRPSVLYPIDHLSALGKLLGQSGPQLFDKKTMSHHLDVLKRLVHQSESFELQAGPDLYHETGTLERLLNQATENVDAQDCDRTHQPV